jgi:hypothetical protein
MRVLSKTCCGVKATFYRGELMFPYRPLLIAAAICVAALSIAAVAASKDDREQLQGRWERSLKEDADAHGAAKAIKEIAGDRETVNYVNDKGEVVYATRADFKLETAGRVKLYTFSNLKVTKGTEQGGDARKSAVSYIYRVEGDLYHEAHGLLIDSPAGSTPNVVTWKRAK